MAGSPQCEARWSDALAQQVRAYDEAAHVVVGHRRWQVGSEAVHDFRVSARRTLAALSVAHALMPPSTKQEHAFEQLRKRTKRPFKALSPMRDWEVACGHLGDLQQPLLDVQPIVQALSLCLRKQGPKVLKQLRDTQVPAALRSLQHYVPALTAKLERVQGAEARERLSRALLVHRHEVRSAWDALRMKKPARFHELRIAFKRIRYACEFLAQVAGPQASPARRIAKACRKLQGPLGEIQDLSVLLGYVLLYAPHPKPLTKHLTELRGVLMTQVLSGREAVLGALEQLAELSTLLTRRA